MARYSDHLFAEVLVPVTGEDSGWPAVDQALVVAGREQARLFGLHTLKEPAESRSPEIQKLQQAFQQRCRDAGVAGDLALEVGQPIAKVKERVVLVDLLVVARSFSDAGTQPEGLSADLQSLVRNCARPVLLVPGSAVALERALLAYDGRVKAREALFVAAYLAECWGIELFVVAIKEPRRVNEQTLDHARKYLAMHEVEATYITREGPVATVVNQEAADRGCDVIIMGGRSDGLLAKRGLGDTVDELLTDCRRPVLICP